MAIVKNQLLQFICFALSNGIDVTVSEQKNALHWI